MTRLSAQDASFLTLETRDTPMHIGFLLTFKLPSRAPADYMQRLHTRLERMAVDAEPFNQQLVQPQGFKRLVQELEPAEQIDLQYHLRHEALPWPGGERELGLAISRLHTTHLERTRPLWECTLIEGLHPGRFALYLKIHHALADGVSLMRQVTQGLAESPRGLSLAPWTAPVASATPPVPMTSVDEEWRRFFESLFSERGKPKAAARSGGTVPRGPRCILNGDTTGRRRFATARVDLHRVKAIAQAADATVNDVVLALCGGALRAYLQEFDRVPKDPLLATVPVALPRAAGQTMGSSVAAVHGTLATHLENPRDRLLAIRDDMRRAKEEFKRLPTSVNRFINSVGMFAMTLLPHSQEHDPEKATFTNLAVSNVPGPKHRLFLHGAELDGMYPVSVLAGDHRLNITVLGYDDGLFFGLIACPDTLPSVQRIAVRLPQALDELEAAMGLAPMKAAPARKAKQAPEKKAVAKKAVATPNPPRGSA
jgi:WS/DGAT/MGAT family acyltransferase